MYKLINKHWTVRSIPSLNDHVLYLFDLIPVSVSVTRFSTSRSDFTVQHGRTKIARRVILHSETYAAFVKMQVTIVVILLSFCTSLAIPGKEIDFTGLPAKKFHCWRATLRSVGRLLAKENIVLISLSRVLHVVTLFHCFILVPLDKSDQGREEREVSQFEMVIHRHYS